MSSSTPAAAAAPGADHGHSPKFYVKIWAILLGLLVVSVVGPMLEIRAITLATAFGIAFVKAFLVVKHFMHLPIEKKYVTYLLGAMLAAMALMVGAVSADVLKHDGKNWENVAAKASVKRGEEAAKNAAAHGDGHAEPGHEAPPAH